MLQEFYLPNAYERSESLGWLLKRLQQSLIGYAERQLCKEGLTHAQWGPLLMLSVILRGELSLNPGESG